MSGLFPVSLLPALLPALLARAGCEAEPEFLVPNSPRGQEIHAALCRDLDEGLALLEAEAVSESNWDFFLYAIAQQHGKGGKPLCAELYNELIYQRCAVYVARPHMHQKLLGDDSRPDIEDCPALEVPHPDDPTPWCACSRGAEAGEPRLSTDLRGVEPRAMKGDLEELVADNLHQVMACYRSDLANCPCPDDSLVLQATVQDGKLAVTESWEGPLSRHQGRAACVERSMRSWRFSEGFSGSFTVHYRIQTEPPLAAAP